MLAPIPSQHLESHSALKGNPLSDSFGSDNALVQRLALKVGRSVRIGTFRGLNRSRRIPDLVADIDEDERPTLGGEPLGTGGVDAAGCARDDAESAAYCKIMPPSIIRTCPVM
jgi:hypothetical protein